MTVRVIAGDCREMLRTLEPESVHCVVTSPPYYGLRDYGTAQWEGGDGGCDHTAPNSNKVFGNPAFNENRPSREATQTAGYRSVCGKCGARRIDRQIGLEPTPDEYIAELVAVFREVKRVLRKDGTVWLNLGDSYHNYRPGKGQALAKQTMAATKQDLPDLCARRANRFDGIKEKDLLMIPARVALALQADGWWLRSDIIWAKPNPMPESVTDRPTSSHEHVFLLAKAERYYFDADAVREQDSGRPSGNGFVRNERLSYDGRGNPEQWEPGGGRNIRNVWTIATSPYSEAHFATFPPELAERCIKAGCPAGGTVLDPFGGAGTTGLVADRLQRNAVLIELNPEYVTLAQNRIRNDAPLFAAE